jgi:hypothetical protein
MVLPKKKTRWKKDNFAFVATCSATLTASLAMLAERLGWSSGKNYTRFLWGCKKGSGKAFCFFF